MKTPPHSRAVGEERPRNHRTLTARPLLQVCEYLVPPSYSSVELRQHVQHAVADGGRGDPEERTVGLEAAVEVEHESVGREQARQARRGAGRWGDR